MARLPQVSVMVALYRESDIAARLVRRLSRLDYPRELLDVVLAVEAEDCMTRARPCRCRSAALDAGDRGARRPGQDQAAGAEPGAGPLPGQHHRHL